MLTAELVTTPGFRSDWPAMPGSQTALALVDAAQQLNTPLLVVSGQPRTSHQLLEACRFFLPDDWGPVVEFPGWEILPYEQFSPHPDLISQRLNILATLPGQGRGLIFTHVATAMQRLSPQSHLDSYGLVLKCHDRLDLDSLRTRLVTAGYTLVSQVLTHGEASIRGGVVDLFPMGSESPFRIDLFDDLVESIKVFDPESQRSTATLEEIRVLPAREFPTDPAAVSQFFRNYQTKFQANAANAFLYRELSNGRVPGGIEFYLPLFFDQTALLTDYLPQHATVAYSADALEQAQAFWNECDDRHAQRAGITDRPPLPPDDIFCRPEELFAAFKSRSAIRFHTNQIAALEESEYRVASHAPEPYARLAKRLETSPARTLFVADSAGRRELILEGLQRSGVHPEPVTSWTVFFDGTTRTAITTGQLDAGLDLDAPPIRVITEAELFGSPGHRRQRRPSRTPDAIGAVVRDLSELRAGDAVVHVDHGVGSYVGLETVSSGGLEGEFLIIAYAGGDRIYVPVTHLHLIHRYVGAETNPPLHKLGSPAWEKARQRAAKRVRDVAAELLAIYARRAARPGRGLRIDSGDYAAFAAQFPFEETADQADAIDAVLADLEAPHAMDRVVCGDVGFGKTEVALRAAFVAALAGTQVAVLAPTTLLAQQHTTNFQDRLAAWPVKVATLSRFQNRAEQRAAIEGIKNGTIDVVIGTQRLLQPDVKFRDLGLLVIDEEHRFGVKQKERFKSMRAEVDVLTLTATPIPRTLNMALAGIRDLSIIATAPERRVAVKTFVRTWDPVAIREACLREFARSGQVYVVHNRVESIDKLAREVEQLVPEATLRVAHGQMPERELEQIMLDFYHQRFNTLVCTTIIESGIDVPSANTIIIDRADRLGLAQLHQLRGRVGRSHHQAYAYLTVPYKEALKGDARKRLEAIEALGDLGIGFTLATHDMEIRGAGELLGDEQTGQIQEIGFTLYNELLEKAIESLKQGGDEALPGPGTSKITDIDLRVPALLPSDYVPDVHLRLVLYKRLTMTRTETDLDELRAEFIDRFGPLPQAAGNLFSQARLALLARPLGITKLSASAEGLDLFFDEQPAIDLPALLKLIQREPDRYRLEGTSRLKMAETLADATVRYEAALSLLQELTPVGANPASRG